MSSVAAPQAPGFAPTQELPGDLQRSGARRALGGFFLSGFLLCFPGAILLSWQHHLSADYGAVGLYFAALSCGLLISGRVPREFLERRGPNWTLATGCMVSALALLYLAAVSPPVSSWFRIGGLVALGWAIGVLQSGIFHAVAPLHRQDAAATVNLAGLLFGAGCFTAAAAIAAGFYWSSPALIQVWLAVVPAGFGWMYWRARFPARPVPHQPPPGSVGRSMRGPGAILLALLVLIQFGNEWAVAGWLALFLSQRLGISPTTALWLLALYWFVLLAGRVAAQWALAHLPHPWLLVGAVAGSAFGSIVLMATNNVFGAMAGASLLAITFSPVYPLIVEKVDAKFPRYSPGFYRQGFTLALAGGFLSPAVAGAVASVWGIGSVMFWPLTGSIVVCVLAILVAVEARLSTNASPGVTR